MRRLLSYDPLTGMYEWFHGDGKGGCTIETYQDSAVVKAIIDRNKAKQNDRDKMKRGIKRGFMRAACIPVGVQHKWMMENHFDLYDKQLDNIKRFGPSYLALHSFESSTRPPGQAQAE